MRRIANSRVLVWATFIFLSLFVAAYLVAAVFAHRLAHSGKPLAHTVGAWRFEVPGNTKECIFVFHAGSLVAQIDDQLLLFGLFIVGVLVVIPTGIITDRMPEKRPMKAKPKHP
jgi:hypothetical protein